MRNGKRCKRLVFVHVSVCVQLACVSLSLTKSHLLSNCGKKRGTRQGIVLQRLALQEI